jgi:NAD-specific glutamate dehydrogenase
MPFLVDSVTMEVNRQGYTLHLLNHPIFDTQRDPRAARVLRRRRQGRQPSR